jgi:UPF0042 nucleotide-binding protein
VERLVIITGLSGSGKSLAANCFEDIGFFCVDNLPVGLVHPFHALIQRGGEQLPHVALVMDARERAFVERFPEILLALRAAKLPVKLLFFECSDDILKRRFSESRRPHPMAGDGGTLEQAIAAEREALQPLRDMADRIIDTSKYTSHELRAFLQNAYAISTDKAVPNVNVVSFGFKYGIPAEADLLFDVRFLPNPFFIDGLRRLDGRTAEVQQFLDNSEVTGQFMDRLRAFVDFLIPHYAAEGKSYLTVALGCTGGKHRSVAMAERLMEHLTGQELPCTVSHRDVEKE